MKLKLPVVRRYWNPPICFPSRYTYISDLDKVISLSFTVACNMGLEPLMFPTGLTWVMVTPLEPPRLAPPLAPGLVLRLDLFALLCLLDLPTRAPFLTGHVRCSRISLPRTVSQRPSNS